MREKQKSCLITSDQSENMPFLMQESFLPILLAMLITRKPVQKREICEKCYWPAVTKGLKKVTNLFQIGLFPHKKVKFACFSTKQVCNVKKKNFQCLIHLLLFITRKYAIICVKQRSIVQKYIHVIESDLCANVRLFALMKVSSRCWSPFHANECVFSRNEQQKV